MNSSVIRVALVTGASRGIGRASALALVSVADFIIVHYVSSRAEAESVVEQI